MVVKDIYYNSGWGSSAQHPSYDYVLSEGKPVGVIRGFKSAGFYTVDDFDYVDGVYKLKAGIPISQLQLLVLIVDHQNCKWQMVRLPFRRFEITGC